MVVVDTSVVLSWTFADESDAFAAESATRVMHAGAVVPCTFPAEVANGLFYAFKRGRISERDVTDALHRIAALPIRVDSPRLELDEEVRLAQAHDLTIYDAMYIALALRHRMALLTRDKALIRAAGAENLS
ncbi:MAG TPA: type II toxin-antitoxin system VapC family toxin [Candidatus Aquilonibacter sp.]